MRFIEAGFQPMVGLGFVWERARSREQAELISLRCRSVKEGPCVQDGGPRELRTLGASAGHRSGFRDVKRSPRSPIEGPVPPGIWPAPGKGTEEPDQTREVKWRVGEERAGAPQGPEPGSPASAVQLKVAGRPGPKEPRGAGSHR